MLLADDLQNWRILLALGAGGVGKTSTSIAVALQACRQGKRVGLLSIDPAKRLAQAMGIPLGSELTPVKLDASVLGKGQLEAAMLDQKAVFDQMVRRFTPTPKVADAVLNNRLYKAVSSQLGGPLEYLALAKLATMVESGDYDLIVVDTPPDTHAMDFLDRPNVLNGFMENRVMTWMVKPFLIAQKFGLGKLLNAGEKLMGSIAKVTGLAALETLAEFLVLMQDVIQGFHVAGERILGILADKTTGILLVTSPFGAPLRSVAEMKSELDRLGYAIVGVILNRCLPSHVGQALPKLDGADILQSAHLSRLVDLLGMQLERESSVLGSLKKTLETAASSTVPIYRVPEITGDLHSISGIVALSEAVGGASSEAIK